MTRRTLDKDISNLISEILDVGHEVEENLYQAIDALQRRDKSLSGQLIQTDKQINKSRIQIGMKALTLMATQQPMASDMRRVATILEIVGELERIHDYIKGISKINLRIDDGINVYPLTAQLPEMVQITQTMLHQALKAFNDSNQELAKHVIAYDDQVDNLYRKTYRDIISFIAQSPADFEYAHLLEWVAHNVERSADRVINICEWVVYMESGEFIELDAE